MLVESIAVGELQSNCYIIADENSKEALVIDPGDEGEKIFKYIDDKGYLVKYIVLTHVHADHISEVNYLKGKTGAKVLIHINDAPALTNASINLSLFLGKELILDEADICVNDGHTLEIGKHEFKVIHTPGHTPGGICLLTGNKLFSGDTLFLYSIGRTDLPGGDFEQLIGSIKSRLFILDNDTVVYPGHGDTTTIGAEKGNLREMF
jgi:glyoxylase-like metal-dependent hydrolase (beta-lactamase superfamily II)